MKPQTIKITPPTWSTVLSWVKAGALKVENADLHVPCKFADAIVKAMQDGKPSITFTFKDGTVEYDDGN